MTDRKPGIPDDKRKRAIFALLAMTIMGVLTLVGLEVAYRAYLAINLEPEIDTLPKSEEAEYRVFSFPIGLTYNREYGFHHTIGELMHATFRNDVLLNCYRSVRDRWSEDAINYDHAAYEDADIKIMLFGSSYTATRDQDDQLATDIAAKELSKQLDRDVRILNLSKGSYGLQAMADFATLKIPEYQPDLVIFAPNTSDIARPRWWPIFPEVGQGFRRYYQSRVPDKDAISPATALMHPYLIYDKIDHAWCKRMNDLITAGKVKEVAANPIVKAVIDFRSKNPIQRVSPTLDVDFFDPTVSYLFNRIYHGNFSFGLNIYSSVNPMRPVSVDRLQDDPQFVEAWQRLMSYKVPVFILHIPFYPEIRDDEEFLHGYAGVPPEKSRTLTASMKTLIGDHLVGLVPEVRAEMRKRRVSAEEIPSSPDNWHPSEIGTTIIGTAMARRILKILRDDEVVK